MGYFGSSSSTLMLNSTLFDNHNLMSGNKPQVKQFFFFFVRDMLRKKKKKNQPPKFRVWPLQNRKWADVKWYNTDYTGEMGLTNQRVTTAKNSPCTVRSSTYSQIRQGENGIQLILGRTKFKILQRFFSKKKNFPLFSRELFNFHLSWFTSLPAQYWPSQAVVPLHKVWHCIPDDEWIFLLRQEATNSFGAAQWSANPTAAEPHTSALFSIMDQVENLR